MATDYWVLVPTASEMNATGVVANAFVVSVAQGSAIDKELLGNTSAKVTVSGKSGYLRAGPFTTLAAANAYLKVGAKTTPSPIPGVGITPSGGVTSNAIPGLSQIGDFFGALTSSNTWIRVAKVLVGGILLIMGLVHMTGTESAVKKLPVPIPV